jgi:CelD/BcsL family acetyltransferase involved in cellulose biosynthesis
MPDDLLIAPLSEAVSPAWKRFVYESRNGTLFHDLDFLAYHPPSRFQSVHLLIRKKGNPCAVFPAVRVKEEGRTSLVSHPGASYGGLVLAQGLGAKEVCQMVEKLVAWAKGEGFERIEMTLPPEICSQGPDHRLEFALHLAGFRIVRRQLTGAIPLVESHPKIANSTMRMVGKARRAGVEVRESGNYKTFYEILVANRSKHGAKPTHTLAELERLKKLVPEHLALFLAEWKGKPIGGTLLFVLNARVVLNFYLAHLWEYQEHRAANLLVYETIQWAKRKGFHYLDMGTSMIGAEPNWSLTEFKERFGAQGFLRDSYELVLR